MTRLSAQKAECVANERRDEAKREAQEKKHTEQMQFLKRTNQQLKVEHGNLSMLLFLTSTCIPCLDPTGRNGRAKEVTNSRAAMWRCRYKWIFFPMHTPKNDGCI